MKEKEKQQLVAEVNILRETQHENIVRYYERWVDKENQKIYIVMEYCDGGDLGTLIDKIKRQG
jgi:NIMA (never in mitosis gene a)-related kinase